MIRFTSYVFSLGAVTYNEKTTKEGSKRDFAYKTKEKKTTQNQLLISAS